VPKDREILKCQQEARVGKKKLFDVAFAVYLKTQAQNHWHHQHSINAFFFLPARNVDFLLYDKSRQKRKEQTNMLMQTNKIRFYMACFMLSASISSSSAAVASPQEGFVHPSSIQPLKKSSYQKRHSPSLTATSPPNLQDSSSSSPQPPTEEEEDSIKNMILSGSWWNDTLKSDTILGRFGSVDIVDQSLENKMNVKLLQKQNGSDDDDDDDDDSSEGDLKDELDASVTIYPSTTYSTFCKDMEIILKSSSPKLDAPLETKTSSSSSSSSSLFFKDMEEEEEDEEKKSSSVELPKILVKLKQKKKQGLRKSTKEFIPKTRERQIRKIKKKMNGTSSFASLPLSDPEHYKERIGRDMRHLSLSIASSVSSPWQWQLFCDEGGGILPLLQCIKEGAQSIQRGNDDLLFFKTEEVVDEESEENQIMTKFMEQHEESFAAACTACRSLRDLCALSDEFAAVVTDDIVRADAVWSTTARSCNHNHPSTAITTPTTTNGNKAEEEKMCYEGGLISHLVTLLKHANEAEKQYSGGGGGGGKRRNKRRNQSGDVVAKSGGVRWGNRRSRREARRRCGLYVVQLLLAMAVSSDDAINRFRETSGFVEVVRACSSYAPKERRRRWFRYPMEVIKKRLTKNQQPPNVLNRADIKRPFIAATAVSDGLEGVIMSTANQLLAAIGYNVWVPKIPGQKGLRILCLDGGGTRGIAAITTLSCIVDAMGGLEVCDAFDVIAGTSTGAIIAFLVGLRRESSVQAKKRYDALIKRIFVKSALSAPMLVFTTATYDEAPFMQVMKEILGENSMLDTRADPAVPLVFGVSSKMSSNPTELCLFRNYNYRGGEQADAFVIDPDEARLSLGLKPADKSVSELINERGKTDIFQGTCVPRKREGSRHAGLLIHIFIFLLNISPHVCQR